MLFAPLRLALRGTETLVGDLVGVGEDVVTVRVSGHPPRSAYVPLDAVEAFSRLLQLSLAEGVPLLHHAASTVHSALRPQIEPGSGER